MSFKPLNISRRTALKGATMAGLVIGLRLDGRAAQAAVVDVPINAFVRITHDNTVTLLSKHTEMGQGTFTGLATILAEEMDADWAQMRAEAAPADVSRYAHFVLKGQQATGGSLSVLNSWDQLRKAGATARAMLVSAAAVRWRVPTSEITVENGVVSHAASKRTATFGALASDAAKILPPENVALKDSKTYKLIGHDRTRLDSRAKADGSARFTVDVMMPGMLTAVVSHSPRFGGTVDSFDASAAMKVPGVVNIVQLPEGVAVVAQSFWAAKKGRDALKVTWDDSKAEMRSTADIFAEYRALADRAGKSVKATGDIEKALSGAVKVVTAQFEFPYLAHAPMEPVDCVVKLTQDVCEIWSGTQAQTADQKAAASITGLPMEKIVINTQFAGGGFGRRGPYDSDFTREAVGVAKAMGSDGTPIKLMWTREDDIRGGKYREMVFHTIEAGLDANGNLLGWRHKIVGQSGLTSGAANTPYDLQNLAVETATAQSPVVTQPWRAVDNTHNAYVIETFIDELAALAGQDPVAFRAVLLKDKPQELAVLKLATERAGWGERMPPGRGRGVALHNTFGIPVAQVADITVGIDGKIKVDRVVCAVDCGLAINPDVIRAQVEGGIGFGLGAALFGEITLKDGRVEQSNFHDYRVLRMRDMPLIEVHIVPSSASPRGIGEPPTPPIAPAVANAIYAVTGKRLRALPFSKHGLA